MFVVAALFVILVLVATSIYTRLMVGKERGIITPDYVMKVLLLNSLMAAAVYVLYKHAETTLGFIFMIIFWTVLGCMFMVTYLELGRPKPRFDSKDVLFRSISISVLMVMNLYLILA